MTRVAVAGGTGTVGTHVVTRLQELGHEPLVLSRSRGVDLVAGTGLDLRGVDAVIDVGGVTTLSARRSRAFFEATTRTLLAAGRRAGVRHHVALSIVGVDAAPGGYYAGKVAQERAVRAGTVPWSVLRATQFHEFAAQTVERTTLGPLVLVPRMRTQPVSTCELAVALVDLALGDSVGDAGELGGPREERLADMVRAYLDARGRRQRVVEVRFPGALGRAMAGGDLLPGPGAALGTETYAEWLARRGR
ncbi:SDR family oxidoreductase [Cellulosimicrobium cellulans]|uniref:SDR family oxidoreductase n=1 Tax=Cellulosimicrobium cellulans TaxID=1710 RepID=UPI000849216E|nr:NAD(P)H-binding protein [Cellulosimicrobium cellulans]